MPVIDCPTIFNSGCQARLNGLPSRTNPHPARSAEYQQWRRGWLHVHRYYGSEAKRGAKVKALPRVE